MIKTEIREFTPEEAATILESNNAGNRTQRRTRIESYAKDMKSGNWKLNGDPIRFNGGSKLVDGQHRLAACVLAKKPFTTVVVYGVTDDAHKTIDTGLNRTFADELRWKGYQNTANIAAVVLVLYRYHNNLMQTPVTISRAESWRFLQSAEQILPALVNTYTKECVKGGFRGTSTVATLYLLAEEHGLSVADDFASSLFAGTDYSAGDPCLALRNYMQGMAASRVNRPTTDEIFAVTIKAANAWLTNRPIKNLSWRRFGPKREPFPTLVSEEDAA